MAKHFTAEYFESTPDELKARLLKICKSGTDNADSGMGMYAMQPEYHFFNSVITKYLPESLTP